MENPVEQARAQAISLIRELEKSFSSISLGQMTVQEFSRSVAGLLKLNRGLFEIVYAAHDRIRELTVRLDSLENELRDKP